MVFTYGAGLAAGGDQQEARKVVVTGKRDGQSSKPALSQPQALRAELSGDTFCSIGGRIGRGGTPVLALCRELLCQGIDPDRALVVYRNGQIALHVRSIGAAAKLTIKSAGNGQPIFARLEGAGAPPVENSNGGDL